MKHNHHHWHYAKTLLMLAIFCVAVVMFKIFYMYQDVIVESGGFRTFMLLACLEAALLVGLVYLVAQSNPPKVKSSSSPRKKKRSR